MSAKELKKLKKAKKKEAKKELIPILLPQFISVENLSTRLNVPLKRFERQLQEMGFEETNGDLILNAENAGLIAQELGYEVIVDRSDELDIKPRPPAEDSSILPQRPPVVTIMGHVDHGKTTLLDWLRKSSIVDSEHGGITQHIGAFSVTMPSGKVITFLDTPGHAAFLSMRERGANVTDIVILVVAADDSVKPQTIEAIKHAKAAEVPIIVAINKCDKDGANIEKVKNDLSVNGVDIEDFGGETQVVCVSGKSGMGMEDLEEATVTLGELLDHRAEPDGQVEGWVLEATTKKRGRVATMLVTRGTLRPGDIIVAGRTWTRIKTLVNEHGEEVHCASPGQPVEVDGWRDQPEAGEACLQADTEDRAKRAVDYRIEKYQRIQQAIDMEAINKTRRLQREKEEREAAIRATAIEAGEDPEEAVIKANRELERNTQTTIEVPLIIKGDVDGSVEACVEALQGIGNSEVKTRIIRASFGEVSEFDIDHAAASGAYVVSFNLPKDPQMFQYARQRGVNILAHNIIYRLADEVKEKVQDRLPPRIKTNVTGEAEVIAIFPIKIKGRKTKNVAGCKINNGLISKKSKVRVLRGPEGAKEEVYNGTLDSLKNVKLDVTEMKKGQECGMGFDGWTEFLVGDRVQSYETVEEKRYL
ncbi:mitochondrial translation initiation factor 2 [Ascodesmis nigricans]|uniref:Translation initiation factor IF-2, mitochondrial n=1 Tax=Ascodesmis nigricans TaxID=341454 RepID=A0A4S2N498_9PEZI|nr:mitochondrial translation initiation factor 2 [Ascodesmis nigricans]